MTTWVVGSGGLLGRAVVRACARAGEPVLATAPVPWTDPAAAHAVFREAAGSLARTDSPWRVVWAAGASTMASDGAAAQAELAALDAVLEGLADLPTRGTFLLASSAGGAYAGSAHPPFGVDTTPRATSAYGRLKLEQEERTTRALGERHRVVVARIANLYGPGQNFAKLQGLISRLALATSTRTPINVFVPLDTIRDYVHVDDAAEALIGCLREAEVSDRDSLEVIASGQPVTVGHLIALVGSVAHRKVPVALGTHASSSSQAPDLRLVPTVEANATPLPAGVRSVYLDILERVQHPSRAASAPIRTPS